MKLTIGGYFSARQDGPPRHVEVTLKAPLALTELLARFGIPVAEVHLAVINGELVDVGTAVVADGDDVRVYPAADGG